MNVDEYTDVRELRENFYIFKVKSKIEFNDEEFQKEIEKLRKEYASSRQAHLIATWLEQKKSKLSREGKLTINYTGEGS
jgi:hypothetical protein